MISQTVRPQIWVIVDDGSTDRTWEIISFAAQSCSWIHAYRRETHKTMDQAKDGLIAASEAIAFLEGLKIAYNYCNEPEYIVKLDAD